MKLIRSQIIAFGLASLLICSGAKISRAAEFTVRGDNGSSAKFSQALALGDEDLSVLLSQYKTIAAYAKNGLLLSQVPDDALKSTFKVLVQSSAVQKVGEREFILYNALAELFLHVHLDGSNHVSSVEFVTLRDVQARIGELVPVVSFPDDPLKNAIITGGRYLGRYAENVRAKAEIARQLDDLQVINITANDHIVGAIVNFMHILVDGVLSPDDPCAKVASNSLRSQLDTWRKQHLLDDSLINSFGALWTTSTEDGTRAIVYLDQLTARIYVAIVVRDTGSCQVVGHPVTMIMPIY